jgi:hypothetical protein
MKNRSILKSINLLFLSGIIFLLSSCIYFERPPRIDNVFVSKHISSYDVESIAILPIIPDDSSNTGAYFATNHLFDILYNNYPSIDITDLQWIRKYDNSIIDKEIQDLKILHRFNMDEFEKSELGSNIISEEYDAVLIGGIDSTDSTMGFFLSMDGSIRAWRTSCAFEYFLISLKDGRVLWTTTCEGEAFNQMDNLFKKSYPPVDVAISNGIDKMEETFPKEIFKKSDENSGKE